MQYGKDNGMINITEQWRIDQQGQIRKKQWLRNLELEEIQRRIKDRPVNKENTTRDVATRQNNVLLLWRAILNRTPN